MRRFPWVATVLLVFFLIIVFGFAWRVFSFYRQIRSGTLDPGTFAQTRVDSAAALRALAARAPGSGVLATDDDPSLGMANAPLTVVEFAEFGCPYSREVSHVVRALAQQYPDKVRYIYRDFPLEDLHAGSELAAVAGQCAHLQGKFWEFHDALFAAQDLTAEGLLAIAAEVGLREERFATCLADPAAAEEVAADLADGYNAGVQGTPTFFFNGEKVEGSIPYDVFVRLIEAFVTPTE